MKRVISESITLCQEYRRSNFNFFGYMFFTTMSHLFVKCTLSLFIL